MTKAQLEAENKDLRQVILEAHLSVHLVRFQVLDAKTKDKRWKVVRRLNQIDAHLQEVLP